MSKTGPARPVTTPTRKQLSRAERERQLQQYILIGTGVVAVLVVLIIGFGVLDQTVLLPRRPVARVLNDEITTEAFQKAVRYYRYQLVSSYFRIAQTAQMFGSDPQSQQYFQAQAEQVVSKLQNSQTAREDLGREVINNLIDEQFIRQEAQKRGITVHPDEIEQQLQESFNYFPNGTPTPTITWTPLPTDIVPPTATPNATQAAVLTAAPTLTPTATLVPTPTVTPGPSPTPFPSATPVSAEAYATSSAQSFDELNKQAELSREDIKKFIEMQLLRDKLKEAIAQDVPTTEEQVHARHILIRSSKTDDDVKKAEAKKKIDEVVAKLNAGEDWVALAAEYSEDPSNAQQGGDLGWFGAGDMVKDFEDAAFKTPVGQVSAPVLSDFGWHIIQVLGHENRPLSASDLEQKRTQAFDEWLAQQRGEGSTDVNAPKNFQILDGWQNYVPKYPNIPTN